MAEIWASSTDWSLIARAGHVDADVKRRALATLLERYAGVLRTHLVARRIPVDMVDDVVQGFLVSKVLEQDLIGRAEREKGRFRNFLLTALDRYAYDRLRELKRANLRVGAPYEEADPVDAKGGDVSGGFDLAWARKVLDETLKRMKEECMGLGSPNVWEVFQCRTLTPIEKGTEPVPYQELVSRFGFASPSQASNVLITAKRMFQRTLRGVISEYEIDDVDAEILDLKRILSKTRA